MNPNRTFKKLSFLFGVLSIVQIIMQCGLKNLEVRTSFSNTVESTIQLFQHIRMHLRKRRGYGLLRGCLFLHNGKIMRFIFPRYFLLTCKRFEKQIFP